ncbi:rod shape-determining protein MreC [Hyphococcus lacteus]|uniref:Cell shape-determining protein MreC n=1 Tax=Hyphococcus lacteus TaxID=3143536 RepID=A0ABV3YZU7_9PROT
MEFLGQDKREGLGRKAHSRFVLVLLMLVSILLLLSSLYSAQASVFKKAREGVMDAASPILSFFSAPINYVHDVAGSVGDYFNVMEQNEALRAENAELRQWMVEALELRETVATYNALQGYQAPPSAQPVTAFVIGESNDAFARSMIVNAGRARNVEVGQAVVDDHGLIGRIVEAGGAASRVLLLTDIQSRIPVYVEGADIEGILVGNTRVNPVITVTVTSDDVEIAPGQRVMTSGSGGALPRGLPVGEVSGERNGGIVVDLYTNYARTRMVRVINYAFPTVDPVEDEATAADSDQPPVEG